MADSIPSLWPKEINVDVQSPLVILKVQAEYLREATKGILKGVVETEQGDDWVQHRLIVVVPAMNNLRRELMIARHSPDMPYPVWIEAEHFAPTDEFDEYPEADSEDEMQDLVRTALQSRQTLAALSSLIAKSNEAKKQKPAQPATA